MDRPGKELRKEYREIALELVTNQGWGYSRSHGRYPMLYPADKSQSPITVALTPNRRARSFENWVAQVRRAGGIWPPPKGRG